MKTQAQKAEDFRALHARPKAFIIPNPWDAGTARMLASLGFEALATTSAGFAFSAGLLDNRVGRERMLAHLGAIAAATDLPVSADLENGFGDDPKTVAETIRLYRELLSGNLTGKAVWSALKATNRIGVTRGTLEERRDPLAIV